MRRSPYKPKTSRRKHWGAEKEKPVNEGKPLGSGKSVLKSYLPEPLLGVYQKWKPCPGFRNPSLSPPDN